MTRSDDERPSNPSKHRRRPARPAPKGAWLLQDAKARFGELIRLVHEEGPQHVSVRGHDEVVVISAEDFRRLNGDRTGAALVEVMRASPHRDVDIAPRRDLMPVRGPDCDLDA